MSVQAKSKLPMLCGTVIVSEVLVLYFAGLTGYGLRPDLVPYGVFVGLLTFTALVLIAAAALLPRRRFEQRPGILLLGWIGQGLILGLGIIITGTDRHRGDLRLDVGARSVLGPAHRPRIGRTGGIVRSL